MAYEGFEGRIGRVLGTSEPWWRPRPDARGKPNVVVMLCDDLGFADLGCYGSEIDTPNLDRLAAEGLQLTNFHVTPMCSPTRAALLTGINPHAAGVGHVANSDPGFPGYEMELAPDAATMAELFRDAGYSTLMVGKWHLSKDHDIHDAGSRHSWPCQRGFDRFYGFLDAFTNMHHPHRLVEDNHGVEVDRYPDGYYVTDDLTDHAISMVQAAKASNPAKPFLLYFAHAAVHAPLQVKPADLAKYRGRYAAGWDAVRRTRFERQLELGVLPEGTELPPRNSEPHHAVASWDELSPVQQELFARYMEVYAGMVDCIDQNFGRLRAELEAMGEWDNTIVVFLSDNGGSREGEENGTSQYFRSLVSANWGDLESVEVDHARLDLLGGPQTLPHYPMGWAMVSSAPFRLYKINTHAGGHSVPCLFSWPAGGVGGGERRRQWQYVTDLLPTLLELAGVERPEHRGGRVLKRMTGASMTPVLRDQNAPSTHREQYVEMIGHRGFYRDGWEIVTLHNARTPFGHHEWELYDLTADPTEVRDLAAEMPDKVRELAHGWEQAAWANQVFPLDEGTGLKYVQRSGHEAVYEEPVTIRPGTPQLERYRSLKLVLTRNFDIVTRCTFRSGDRGYLFAHGDQGGGYGLYVDGDELVYVHNEFGTMRRISGGTVPDGASEIRVSVTTPGQLRWNVRLSIDGREVGGADGLVGFLGMAPFEGIDVGLDRKSPVDWSVYEREGTFAWTGELHSVTWVPGELAPDAGARWIDFLREQGRKFE